MRVGAIAAGLLVLLLAAQAQAAAPTSGVQGIVLRGPVRPVCEEMVPCDAPYSGAVLVFTRHGAEVKRVTTSRDARYAVRLAAGLYTVRLLRKVGLIGMAPRVVRVPTGRFLRLDLYVDTGIR